MRVDDTKPESTRDRPSTSNPDEKTKNAGEDEWIEHQRREFPKYKFYLDDSVNGKDKGQIKRAIKNLGAMVELFYDIDKVTHIVTLRKLFKEDEKEEKEKEEKEKGHSNEDVIDQRSAENEECDKHQDADSRTISSIVEKKVTSSKRPFGSLTANTDTGTSRNDAISGKRIRLEGNPKKSNTNERPLGSHEDDVKVTNDIDLALAHRNGIKIWHVDKCVKIISKLLNTSIMDTEKSQEEDPCYYSIFVGDSANIRRPICSRKYLDEAHCIDFHYDLPGNAPPFQTLVSKREILVNPDFEGTISERSKVESRKYCENCEVRFDSLTEVRFQMW